MNYYNQIPRDLRDFVIVPIDQSAFDGYGFEIISEMEHSRGVAWSARVVKDGRPVCVAENSGHGELNNYVVVNDDLYLRFQQHSKNAYPSLAEPQDAFVQFLDVYSSVMMAPQ